jgi:hypothetical protein
MCDDREHGPSDDPLDRAGVRSPLKHMPSLLPQSSTQALNERQERVPCGDDLPFQRSMTMVTASLSDVSMTSTQMHHERPSIGSDRGRMLMS